MKLSGSKMVARKMAVVMFLFWITSAAFAQPIAEFSERLGGCSAQNDKTKRAACFERLARDAIARLSSDGGAKPTHTESKFAAPIAEAKAAVIADFKDPSSVIWRNLRRGDFGGFLLCGELNGKNSYGGYIGFRKFSALQGVQGYAVHIADPQHPDLTSKVLIDDFCKNADESVE
jgi:hypothetical protein